ncbi:hypothetical protein [Dongia sp.]|uniref:hypothetical protein n=1 Tax=Dongia sp. TaxID=1977262 RepID=UPI0037514B79
MTRQDPSASGALPSLADGIPDNAVAERKRTREILERLSLQSSCGRSVAVSRQAKAILEPHPDLVLVLSEALSKVHLRRGWMDFEIDLGRRVGWENYVPTKRAGLDDEISFVMRRGHLGASRVEVNELCALEPTAKVTLVIDGGWPKKHVIPHLVTAWIGGLRPPEPWEARLSARDTIRALEFWSGHAFDNQPDAQEGRPFRSTFREVIREAKVTLACQKIFRRN